MGLLGGILGGIVGSMFAGPWGAAIGAGIGYIWSEKKGGSNSPAAPLFSLFRALAKLAKADGVVSADEAAFISELIRNFGGGDPDLRKALKAEFDNAKNSNVVFADEVRNLKVQLPPDARRSVMEIFCLLARIDNTLDDSEKAMLLQAEAIFNLTGFVDNFFNGSRQRSASSPSTGGDLAAAYQTLGINPSASDDEVKAAWHRKTKEFHPDHLAGKGLSEAFIEFAEEEMKKVNLAYETILKARKR